VHRCVLGLPYCTRLPACGQPVIPFCMYILDLLSQSPAVAIASILAIVVAITFHEFAHAWTADRLGDDTPSLQGRVTLNPLAHLDPVGSVLFLLFRFGWGKPVIYNPMRLKRRSDELLIALAGPASNLLLAFIFNLAAYLLGKTGLPVGLLGIAADTNVLLAAFNILPIPPLDGSSIVAYFWPEYRSLLGSQIGVFLLLAVVFLGGSLLNGILLPVENFFYLLTHLFGLL
jgi:Zn-dependent protease